MCIYFFPNTIPTGRTFANTFSELARSFHLVFDQILHWGRAKKLKTGTEWQGSLLKKTMGAHIHIDSEISTREVIFWTFFGFFLIVVGQNTL